MMSGMKELGITKEEIVDVLRWFFSLQECLHSPRA